MSFPLKKPFCIASLLAATLLSACGTSPTSSTATATGTSLASNIEAENKGRDPVWFNAGYQLGPGHQASGIMHGGG
jgi:hypothetical protein